MHILAYFLLAAASTYYANGSGFSYSHQHAWPGICVSGNRQSPIDIPVNHVMKLWPWLDSELKFRGMGNYISGSFSNTGHNVQFDLDYPGISATYNLHGEYILQQVHMHWGRRTGEGSEHRING